MRIAIIIGVSEYDALDRLPGGSRDADLMGFLAHRVGAFQDVLVLNRPETTTAKAAKSELVQFVERHQKSVVDEVLFYFSGHGALQQDDFMYLMSDYTDGARRQTALENGEVDQLLRSLNAKLVVKVIDACSSGTSYIKDEGATERHFEKSRERFNHLYFMFSSLAEQASVADRYLSYFTASWARAVLAHVGKPVRYKDLMDHISDYFETHRIQTPYFISQAKYTEKFGDVPQDIEQGLKPWLQGAHARVGVDLSGTPMGPESGETGLVATIRRDAERYVSREETASRLVAVETHLLAREFPEPLQALYAFDVFTSKELKPGRTDQIAKWLDESPHDYFARVTYRTELKEPAMDKARAALLAISASIDENVQERYYRTVPSGIQVTWDAPYRVLVLEARRSFPNIPSWQCVLLPVVSKTEIRWFYHMSPFVDVDWDTAQMTDDFQWRTMASESKMEGHVLEVVESIVRQFEQTLFKSLEEKFGHDAASGGERVPQSGQTR